jgi:uncharacterized membrane protein
MRAAAALYYASLVVVVAGLVHLSTVLIAPNVAEHDAFARVVALAEPYKTTAAPASRAFPYADPTVATTVCRYDLASAPVRVRAPLSRPGFAALAFHSRRGAVFYALTDRAAAKGRLEALIVTHAQLRVLASRDDEDNPSQDLRIVAPDDQGFVTLRVLSQSPDDMPAAAEQAAAMTCAPEPIAEAEK